MGLSLRFWLNLTFKRQLKYHSPSSTISQAAREKNVFRLKFDFADIF